MLERASEKPFEKFNEPGGQNNEGFSSFFILGLSYEQNIKHIGKTYSTLIQPRDSMEPYATPHTT